MHDFFFLSNPGLH